MLCITTFAYVVRWADEMSVEQLLNGAITAVKYSDNIIIARMFVRNNNYWQAAYAMHRGLRRMD